jgi:hypothetical protein
MSNEVSSEGARAVDELEQLRKQKEQIELKAQIEALTTPWWRKASLIATMTAIIAAVLPITTAIEEHYRNEREYLLQQSKQDADITLQQVKQENDIRLAYLDRFDVPGQRLQTLRFLLATSTDARLIAWAREEQKVVQDQLDKIEEELVAVTKKIEQAPPGQLLEELKKDRDELKRLKAVKATPKTPRSGSAPQ